MATADYHIRQGDSGFVMQDTLKDADGAAVLIQGATVKLQVWPIRGGAALVDDAATNNDDGTAPNKGKVAYTWPGGDTATAGDFVGQWHVTFGGGSVLTFPNDGYILIRISADPPATTGQRYVQLEEFKATVSLFGESFADEDAAGALDAASRHVDKLCGWPLRRFWADADANQVRVYTATWATGLEIHDLVQLTTLKTDAAGDGTYETTWSATDYFLEPLNAAADGRPYTRICRRPTGALTFPVGVPEGVQVTGKFGWPSVPAEVRDATTLVAHRLLKRKRENPYSTVGFGMDDSVVRIPTRDPDVMALLSDFRRNVLLS